MESSNQFINELQNNNSIILDKIVKIINKSKKIAVLGHIEPDGDTIGAQLALYYALKENNFYVELINEGPYDNKYISINKNYFKKSINPHVHFDLYIIVDTPSKDRIGKASQNIDYSKCIVIDHHITNCKYGKINWIEVDFISSSEMIFILLNKMNIGLENPKVCQNLLNGIVADNGLFRHVRKDKYYSLLISYLLIKKGADPSISYNIIFGKKSLSSKKILSLVLQRLEPYKTGKVLWTYITDKDKKFFNNSMVDSSSVFNEIMSVNGVEIAIFFKVDKNTVDMSFRSVDNINVSKLAKYFGGGGHIVASGATLTGDFDEIKNKVLKKSLEFVSRR